MTNQIANILIAVLIDWNWRVNSIEICELKETILPL